MTLDRSYDFDLPLLRFWSIRHLLTSLKRVVKRTPLCVPFIIAKGLITQPRAQNDEAFILNRLLRRYELPKRFLEFGFSGWEFNCASLVRDWEGLLVDGDAYNVRIARLIYPRIQARALWLTLDRLGLLMDYAAAAPLGILSVDVDGNDYWFLERLIVTRPALIIAEYNSSFGLRPVTVPYDPHFDRTRKHESWSYFGASLTALDYLAKQNGYSLIEIGNSGVNAFFIRNDFLTPDDLVLSPESSFREKLFYDGSRPSGQWNRIEHLPFVDVRDMSVWS